MVAKETQQKDLTRSILKYLFTKILDSTIANISYPTYDEAMAEMGNPYIQDDTIPRRLYMILTESESFNDPEKLYRIRSKKTIESFLNFIASVIADLNTGLTKMGQNHKNEFTEIAKDAFMVAVTESLSAPQNNFWDISLGLEAKVTKEYYR